MDAAPVLTSGCKTSSYLIPMIVVLILFVAAFGFVLWYYLTQLKPRLNTLVFDKTTGAVGFKDASNSRILLQPPQANATGQSSRLSLLNDPSKSNLDYSMFTIPIAGNTKQQVQLVVANRQGSAVVPLTTA